MKELSRYEKYNESIKRAKKNYYERCMEKKRQEKKDIIIQEYLKSLIK